MKKVINPIGKKTYGGKNYNVYFLITDERGYLSISGVEGPTKSGNCYGGCGQIDMHLKEEDRREWTYKDGYNDKVINKIFQVWERWHLKPIKECSKVALKYLESLPESKVKPAWC